MSLPTYQSIQSNTSTGTTNVVTKPASLAVGDLLVAISAAQRNAGGTTITLPTGFTQEQTSGSATTSYATGWKIADAGDVAASNFTFSIGSAPDDWISHLVRVSASTSFASPFVSKVAASEIGAGTPTTNPTFTINLNPITADGLVFAVVLNVNALGGGSNYTFSGSNPTWSERYDRSDTDISMLVATCQTGTISTITTFECDTVNSEAAHTALVFVVAEVTNASGTAALHSASPSFFAPAAVVGGSGTAALHSASPSFPTPVASANSQAVWSNPDKTAAPTWTNQDRS